MTQPGSSLLRIAVVSIGAALLVASTSLLLGARVHYLDHLALFNALAISMLSLGLVGLATSVVGLWKARLRSARFSVTGCVALLFVIRLMLDG